MTEHQRKLHQRAEHLFAREDGPPRSRGETLRLARKFYKIEDHRLRIAHRAGGSGLENCRMRSDVTDALVRFLWEETLALIPGGDHLPISVVANGGYGRSVMNPHSDLDLLFLFPGNNAIVGPDAAKAIGDFTLFLFDMKFKLSPVTRSVGETLRLANDDNETKTTLIQSRLLAGKEEAFKEFLKRFDKECMVGREAEFLQLRQEDLANRHAKHENTAFVQEPNVKTGCGGLRDYQSTFWMTYAKLRTTNLKVLVERGMISRSGFRELEEAHDFILRVRNEMHYVEKRAQDVLTMRLQGVVATNLGYRHKTILRRIEAFMRDYYTAARDILQRTSEVMDGFHLQVMDEGAPRPLPLLGFLARRKKPKVEKFDGFIAKNERIYAENDRIFKEDPARLMRLFRHTQQRHLRLSPELFQLVQRSFNLVNQSYRYNKAVRESFESILSQKGDVARVLRQMHRVGFLGRFMPEFGALEILVQHEFFHRYTADEHTLRTIERLDELAGASGEKSLEFYKRLFTEMQEPWILYLALLLHDAGRASNSASHAEESTVLADAVCRRLQIKGDSRRLLLFLVDNHLLLYQVATGKNLEDPKVIEDFCAIVRSKQHLDALMVMTVADSKGTSEQSWTGYKEASVRQLYHGALMRLNAPADFMQSAHGPLDQLKKEVLAEAGPELEREVEAHFLHMPRAYFGFRRPRVIADHIELVHQFFVQLAEGDPEKSLLPVLQWVHHPDQGHSVLVVTGWDRHLLLARIAGALAAESINILSAKLYRRTDFLVLDTFRVCTTSLAAVTSERALQRVEKAVHEAFMSEEFDFDARIHSKKKPQLLLPEVASEIPQRIHIHNGISDEHTVIELQAVDRIGLLYDIFMTIGRLGFNITHARINTEQGAAIDAIYLQTQSGEKILDETTLRDLHEALTRAVFKDGSPL